MLSLFRNILSPRLLGIYTMRQTINRASVTLDTQFNNQSNTNMVQQPEKQVDGNGQTANKIYVQHVDGNDMMTISFEFGLNGKTKRFNLYRKTTDPLSSCLERIRLNLEKMLNPKKKPKLADPQVEETSTDPVKLELHHEGCPIDPGLIKNIDAWVDGSVLQLQDKPFRITRNEPQVGHMKLPTPLMKGYIILPEVSLANCDVDTCDFIWYRQISAIERRALIEQRPSIEKEIEVGDRNNYWLKLASGITYSPTEEDLAHHLQVVCCPSDGKRIGLKYACVSKIPVEVGPESCPFEKRHLHTSNTLSNDQFRFVTYNILADLYADSNYSRNVLFAHCPAYALEIEYRRQLLLKEIIGYNADVVCLQEVDRKEFIGTYRPFFELVGGHSGVFDTKGGQVAEGMATFYRKNRFKLIDSHRTIISDLIDPAAKVEKDNLDEPIGGDEKSESKTVPESRETKTDSTSDPAPILNHPILKDLDSTESKDLLAKFDSIRAKILSHPPLYDRFIRRHTALQTSLLQFKDRLDNYLVVANTHLYFAPDADHVRLLQASICVKYMEYIKDYYKTKIGTNSKVSIIFCGDMNSSPDCGLFKLMHQGKIGSDIPDWSSNPEEAVDGLTIETSLKFKSAYQDIPYTNYTPGFNGCLDYIYYDVDRIDCLRTIPLPNHEDVVATDGIPSDVFPSDHIALIADLELKK